MYQYERSDSLLMRRPQDSYRPDESDVFMQDTELLVLENRRSMSLLFIFSVHYSLYLEQTILDFIAAFAYTSLCTDRFVRIAKIPLA